MIYFIGAGPGDAELITVKGMRLLGACDVVIYAGSLINPEILKYAKKDAEFHDSSRLNLEEIIEIMKKACEGGQDVARLHTGDPSIYGAVREQMERLDELGIGYEVCPGVSSFTAAAAVLKKELTVPGVSQTLIITRLGGRTPVPEGESLKSLAKHGASMAIFLSADMIDKVIDELTNSYGPDTPAAVVYKATWPEQKIVMATLKDMPQRAKQAGIDRTAIILVGDFLGKKYERSMLYHSAFSHGFRTAEKYIAKPAHREGMQ
ncbi:MAG: precorrin-4 C(11)-methyltransferase [Tepidanaerobacteraceae bacterium]|jgi:precorrin-4/cobalt-precorrin-4 C11-methyltransferase|nr:precorrin-4 C(11)-methyltransferase [Tepidanaerobacteraceae bacterium]